MRTICNAQLDSIVQTLVGRFRINEPTRCAPKLPSSKEIAESQWCLSWSPVQQAFHLEPTPEYAWNPVSQFVIIDVFQSREQADAAYQRFSKSKNPYRRW